MSISRRVFLTGTAASLCAGPALANNGAAPPPRYVTLGNALRPGDIHVLPDTFSLLFVLPDSRAIHYTVGVSPQELWYPGTYRLQRMAEWPRWTPTAGMIRRQPDLYRPFANGIPGGPDNPMGSRALYLYQGGRDTLLRIHGMPTNQRVRTRTSNGCVKMDNAQIADLANRVSVGARVVFH